ncbi:hypothetical protein BH20ACI4_BH20ACI4_17730 [soil metagenome]
MTKSETSVALTADDINTLREKKIGNGCLWVVAVPAALIFLFFVFMTNWSSSYLNDSLLLLAAIAGISLVILYVVYKFTRKNDGEIAEDIRSGRKRVITAPITDKRIESSEITRGREKGGISSKYFMTVDGVEYPMTEHKYLTIRVGEFMEIHQAPVSKIIIREKWLKQDGTVEEDKNEIED